MRYGQQKHLLGDPIRDWRSLPEYSANTRSIGSVYTDLNSPATQILPALNTSLLSGLHAHGAAIDCLESKRKGGRLRLEASRPVRDWQIRLRVEQGMISGGPADFVCSADGQ
jgi:hypothetical protein